MRSKSGLLLVGAVGVLLVAGTALLVAGDTEKPAAALSLEQARREVRLLDDLYKTAVIYINDVYVEDENSVAAGETARELFAAMKAKGWHEARLVDATGEPLNDENIPKNEFEKTAIVKIKSGQPYFDAVVEENDRKFLRAATLLPVVNEKCILCHPGNKVGDVLGAISYKIRLK